MVSLSLRLKYVNFLLSLSLLTNFLLEHFLHVDSILKLSYLKRLHRVFLIRFKILLSSEMEGH